MIPAVGVTVYLDPATAARLTQRARAEHCSEQAQLRRAIAAHLEPQHPAGEGAGGWPQDVANGSTW